MKPIVRLPDAQPEKVSDFFLPGSRQWDVQLVEDTFCTRDAEEILKIRPRVRMTEDVLAWALEKSGVYSVCSCYRLLKKESAELESLKLGETTTSSDEFRWWQKIWKLKVPPKIRIFWWRACQDYLPSKAELRRRHVTEEDHCESCGQLGESLYHIAISCPLAVRFWKVLKELTGCKLPRLRPATCALFVWLISHQPAVLFSQNKPAISSQPAVLFSHNKSAPATSHQPNEQT
jgi:hypothetical protein